MSGIVHKIRDAVSPHNRPSRSGSRERSADGARDPSSERGRETIRSTGRGGAGNFTNSRPPPEERPQLESIDEMKSQNRGRLPTTEHVGRGGHGNVRSPSRDPASREREIQQELQDQKIVAQHDADASENPGAFATGRGGAGNIRQRSASRPRGEEPINRSSDIGTDTLTSERGENIHTTGKGGFGNMTSQSPAPDDSGNVQHDKSDSTSNPGHIGRGGIGNVTSAGINSETHET